MEIFEKRICKICGNEYTPVNDQQAYCSIKCRKANAYLNWKKKHGELKEQGVVTKKVIKKKTMAEKIYEKLDNPSCREKVVVNELHYDHIDIKIIKYVNLYYWKAFRNGNILLESEYFDDEESCTRDARHAFK